MKKAFENEINKVVENIERQGELYMTDVRYLCERGIPAVEIAIKNIPIEYFKKGLMAWLNNI